MRKNVLFGFVVAVASICPGQWLERQVVPGDGPAAFEKDDSQSKVMVQSRVCP